MSLSEIAALLVGLAAVYFFVGFIMSKVGVKYIWPYKEKLPK